MIGRCDRHTCLQEHIWVQISYFRSQVSDFSFQKSNFKFKVELTITAITSGSCPSDTSRRTCVIGVTGSGFTIKKLLPPKIPQGGMLAKQHGTSKRVHDHARIQNSRLHNSVLHSSNPARVKAPKMQRRPLSCMAAPKTRPDPHCPPPPPLPLSIPLCSHSTLPWREADAQLTGSCVGTT